MEQRNGPDYPRYQDLKAEVANARDLIAAVVEALEVPAPADISPRGTEKHLSALRDHATCLRGSLRSVVEGGRITERAPSGLRDSIAECVPITYKPFGAEPLPIFDDQAPKSTSDELGELLMERVAQVRDQLTASRLPSAMGWEIRNPIEPHRFLGRVVKCHAHIRSEARVTAAS